MYVYAVRSPEGWLYRDEALMVFIGQDDAEADAHEPDAEVVRLKAQAITKRLEDGDLAHVRLVNDPGEHYLVGLKGWRELVEHVESEQRAMLQRHLVKLLTSGEISYDHQTGRYTNLTLGDPGDEEQ